MKSATHVHGIKSLVSYLNFIEETLKRYREETGPENLLAEIPIGKGIMVGSTNISRKKGKIQRM